ncbi:nuclear pore complex protein Nup153 isoform X1 [Drosophila mauritiana]|uniref:Nuclear pore complex protein Nup153 n=1 Tax=Drosophila mauritiana TaxID=7226 RepID=A0A6P8LAH8_DROMA|nr:nuclear pore complex protein Nup153 isoform X1 [Drosophila mauritiana]XP_033171987.1 nuclear pore complex protein Nup153 isoform X1 [Drosophila mauritiana]
MEDAQEQRESSQAELAKKHPLTPLKELPEESEEEEEEDESSAGAQREADSNNSIMGKMKMRVSSILPASLSGWFSPSSKDGNDALSSPANLRQSQPRQSNGRSTTKRKRGRRRIMLAEADADAADDLDDGSDAKGLNYEEVALADNIAEHDLAAEDEQTRRSEYNVFLLRKRAGAIAAAGGDEDEAEEDELEEDDEEGDEEDDDEEQENLQQSARVQTKRRRLELETPVNLPNMRRLPLLSSTPAAPLAAATSSSSSQMYKSVSQLAPHRRNHLNLYGNQRQREPAYNFFTGNEAAEGSTGDLPHSTRRSLNIPFGGSSTATSYNNSLSSLPNHKRPPLIGKRTHRRDLTMDETGTGPDMSSEEHLNHLLGISRTNNNTSNNNNNNNNNVIKTKTRRSELSAAARGGGDSQSESDLNECHDNGEGHEGLRPSHYNSNSNFEFYGNLQSSKSIFNRSNAAAQQSHRNSTWSLNSLTQRRRFNASIYGSTSALSDSRLLSGSASNSGSASASSSPFYQGRTTFGGYSGNNRLFSRSNLSSSAASSIMGLNSAGSSPAHPLHASMTGGIGYGIKAVDMRPSDSGNLAATSVGQGCSKKPGTGLSNTTMRILSLLESYSTPLIDAKRMGSSIKEHQSSRQQRLGTPATPYLRSTSASSNAPVPNHINELAELRSNKLLVPTMQQLLERRRLHRVTQNSRDVVHSQNVRAGGENNEEKPKQAAPYVAPIDQSANHTHHTNKMRSRLSHQTRNKEPRTAEEEAPPPLELPQISFPEMASAPKFDLIIKPTVPVVSKPSTTDPIPSSKSISSNLSTTNSKQMPNFLANPQPAAPIVNFAANGNVPAISEPTRRTFTFSEPIPLSNFRENCILKTKINRNFTFPSPASLDDLRTTNEQSQPTINGTPSSKEWECDTCMVRNKPEVNKCVACETAKPVASAATAQAPSAPPTAAIETQSFGGFGDRFKKSTTDWECDACMLSNKAEASKCIACETPRKTVAPKVNNFSPLITNAKSNEWECSVCLVRNKVEVSKCVACESAKPGPTIALPATSNIAVATPSMITDGFGDRFKKSTTAWECDACMLSNKAEASKCIACETPRKTSTPIVNSLPSMNNNLSAGSGFDMSFMKKANMWECQTCLVMNKSSVVECIACQTPNSTASSNNNESAPSSSMSSFPLFSGTLSRSSSRSSSGSASTFGSVGSGSIVSISSTSESSKTLSTSKVPPKPDTGFQQLVAAQKSATWECEACLAKNDMSRKTCICCEQMMPEALNPATATDNSAASSVPKFRFGFSHVKEVVKPSVETTTTPAPTSAQFSFGFGQSNQGKDVADSKKTEAPKTFSFGVSKVEEPKTVAFGTDIKETTATSSSEATAPDAAAAAAPLQFVFKAPTTATTAASSITTTISTTSNAPALGGFRFGAPSSSSAVSSSTASSSANPAAVKPMFSFSGAGSAVSSTSSSQQPVAKATTMGFGVSSSTVTTTTTSTKVFAFTPASAPAPSAVTSTPAPAAGLTFGSQSKPATTQNTGTFFFGQPTAAAPATPTNSSVSSIFGAPATSTTANTSVSATTSTANAIASSFATTSTPQLFGNWGENKTDMTTSSATKPFTFGAPSVSGTTTTPSFGWSSNGDAAKSNSVAVGSAAVPSSSASKMATPIFGSSSMFGPSSSSNNTTSTTSLPFGSSATTAATTPAAGGNGPLTGIFGNAGNSLVGVGAPVATTPAPTAAAPLANFFGNPTPVAAAAPVFGSGSTITSAGFGAPAAAAPLAGTALPGAFNFGGATAATPAASSAPYKFGSSTNEPLAKPAFNFTGSAASSTAPAPAFNFTANTAATNLTGGDQSHPRIFQFGSSQPAANSAGGMPMFNFAPGPPQMQLQSASRWQLGAEFPNGSPQNPCPRTPSAAPVEMASQSAITIANEAAVGLGLGFRVPLPRVAGSAVAEAEASRAEDTGEAGGNNSELNGSVQSQYHQEPDIQGSSRMYMQPRQPPFVNKYRFVRRRHSLDGSTNAVVPFSRNKWRRTAEQNTAGEGHKTSGGDVPETPTTGDQEDNHQEGRHSPVYTSTERTVLIRTQFKIVRQMSVISRKKSEAFE